MKLEDRFIITLLIIASILLYTVTISKQVWLETYNKVF